MSGHDSPDDAAATEAIDARARVSASVTTTFVLPPGDVHRRPASPPGRMNVRALSTLFQRRADLAREQADVDERIAAEFIGNDNGASEPPPASRPRPTQRVPPVRVACDQTIPVPETAVRRAEKGLRRYFPNMKKDPT